MIGSELIKWIYDNNIEDLLENEEQSDKVVLSKVASKMAGVKCPPDYNPGFCYPDDDCHSCWIGWLHIKNREGDNFILNNKTTENRNSKVAAAYHWAEKDCDTFLLKKIYVKGFMRGIEEYGKINSRKTGEWIPCGNVDVANNQDFLCSCCGSGDTHAVNVSVPFCWKCGAVMRDEKSKQTI